MKSLFTRIALLLLVVSTTSIWATAQPNYEPTPQAQQQTDTVNINTADLDTLQKLPRVGPVLAQRILEFREKNGKFTSKEDLKKVSGIGDKTFERLKDLISL